MRLYHACRLINYLNSFMPENSLPFGPIFSHVEPVLPVKDIAKTIQYWQKVLGFQTEWTWGEPPNIGAVSWQKVHVQFILNPELAESSIGNSLWIRVRHIDALYEIHQRNGAEIVDPPSNKPWGMTQYAVRDNNGYYLVFADIIREHQIRSSHLPAGIVILSRKPQAEEYESLKLSVGWGASPSEEDLRLRLSAAIYGAVAEDTGTGNVIGCGLVLGDHASFFYVKDLMVHPQWQGQRVGTALMKELSDWIEKNAPNNSLAALICGEGLESFYQKFGFATAFAMIRYTQRGQ
jgi:GNAT superfamily N-acetyltransferase/uncharacterized glyoxalase superfamily protein PhnB